MLKTITPNDTETLVAFVNDKNPASWRSNITLLNYLKSRGIKESETISLDAEYEEDAEINCAYAQWHPQTLAAIKSTFNVINGLFALQFDGLWGDVLVVEMGDEVNIASVGDQISQQSMPRQQMIDLIIKMLFTGSLNAAGKLFSFDGGDERGVIETLSINRLN
jgi:hypothetical protein